MKFYRGDDRQPSQIREKKALEPWEPMGASQAYSFLMSGATGKKKPMDFTNFLRVETCRNAIATSRKTDAGFEQRTFFYEISIPDDVIQLRRITSHGIDTQPLDQGELSDLNLFSGFVVFDGPTVQESEVIGYGHGKSTVDEVTFLTPIPLKYISGYKPGGDKGNPKAPFIPVAKPSLAS